MSERKERKEMSMLNECEREHVLVMLLLMMLICCSVFVCMYGVQYVSVV